jgi:hypothetical protein
MVVHWKSYIEEIPDVVILSVYFDPHFKKFPSIANPVARGIILSRASALMRSLVEQLSNTPPMKEKPLSNTIHAD